MKPLATLPAAGIAGVFTDVDDTMTTDGLLTEPAFRALHELARAGLAVVPVTGRSAGWAHMIVKTWPVAAVIAESGGLYLLRDAATGRLVEGLHDEPARVRADRDRLARTAAQVLQAVPGLAPASDNAYRRVDLALDHSEEVPPVPAHQVARAIELFRDAGFSARASSVHVNAWAGEFDKAPMALRLIAERLSGGPLADPRAWAFIGDAPNDASMFATFTHTVGVANIADHGQRLTVPPAYVTRGRFGDGFVEFAAHLLAGR